MHIEELGTRSNQLYTLPAFQQWNIDPMPSLKFYRRQVDAIGTSLRRWLKRGGATEADLDRIDAQMQASVKADLDFAATIQQQANYQQQLTGLMNRSSDFGGEIDELNTQAVKLRGSGDYPGASVLDAQAEPLVRQKAQLDKTHDQIYELNNDLYKKSVAAADAMGFVEPTPSGRVTGVVFEMATEAEPEKLVVAQFPLKGAPVSLSLNRQVTDVTLGIPIVVKVDWEQEDGEAPAEQTLRLDVGAKTVTLSLRPNGSRTSYYSQPIIFQQPAAPPAPLPDL